MLSNPLVSIIIPAYNAEKYIEATIQSIVDQTWNNLEIIIVNDGSTDDTEKIIQGFLSDKRIKYVTQTNKGCSGAKNTGLLLVSGDFIQYLDADDILSLDKIEQQLNVIHDTPFKIAICRTKLFHEEVGDSQQEVDSDFLYDTANPFEFMLNLYGLNGKDGMIQPNAFLISKQLSDLIGSWDTTISPSPDEDGEYFCRVMLKAKSISITEGMNYYRKQKSSMQSLSKQHDYLHTKGLLGSLILKADNLFAFENSERVKTIMGTHFASFIYLYDHLYKDLSQRAEDYIYKMGFKKIPDAGGEKFKIIANLIGFKNALKIKNFFL
ncbi:MAG TPA: glycosyltransferase family 2 protein [Ferruginibacter sp.]|nr:glycosyltransferase family 2 protein [Ferruginibacter sp.]